MRAYLLKVSGVAACRYFLWPTLTCTYLWQNSQRRASCFPGAKNVLSQRCLPKSILLSSDVPSKNKQMKKVIKRTSSCLKFTPEKLVYLWIEANLTLIMAANRPGWTVIKSWDINECGNVIYTWKENVRPVVSPNASTQTICPIEIDRKRNMWAKAMAPDYTSWISHTYIYKGRTLQSG